MKLISMTDFVLDQYEKLKSPTLFEETVFNYAKFLKQPPTLGMFVPCDEENNVLESPLHIELYEGDNYDSDCKKYQEAKERVLFYGFETTKENFIHNTKHFYVQKNNLKIFWNFNDKWKLYKEFKTIEDLVQCDLSLAVSFEAIT